MSNRQISQRTKTFIRAKEIISDPDHWCKHYSQKSIDGRAATKAEDMHSFCMTGAIMAAINKDLFFELYNIGNPDHPLRAGYQEYLRSYGFASQKFGSLSSFNDDEETTHDMVMQEFDKIISWSIMEDQNVAA